MSPSFSTARDSDSAVKFSCENVWKVFGAQPKRFLDRHRMAPSEEDARREGYICAVRDVSFDVKTSEILVVMGLSGSGKSTLVRCLSRLVEPTTGSIRFDGQDLLTLSDRELTTLRRHKMGMVFQHFGLLPHRTVLENVAFPLEAQGVKRREREQRALEKIRLVGLEGRESYYPRELSGGQQQRVGIARSLVIEPEVWFLDEPFSALDPLIRRDMQDEFLRLQSMLQKTIVFITHDFAEAIRLADRIAIMKDGRIIQIGAPEEIVACPIDDYVAKFTQDAPRGRVLKVENIMDEAPPETAGAATETNGARVRADSRLEDVAPDVLQHARASVPVVDGQGMPIGILRKEALVQALFQPERDVCER